MIAYVISDNILTISADSKVLSSDGTIKVGCKIAYNNNFLWSISGLYNIGNHAKVNDYAHYVSTLQISFKQKVEILRQTVKDSLEFALHLLSDSVIVLFLNTEKPIIDCINAAMENGRLKYLKTTFYLKSINKKLLITSIDGNLDTLNPPAVIGMLGESKEAQKYLVDQAALDSLSPPESFKPVEMDGVITELKTALNLSKYLVYIEIKANSAKVGYPILSAELSDHGFLFIGDSCKQNGF